MASAPTVDPRLVRQLLKEKYDPIVEANQLPVLDAGGNVTGQTYDRRLGPPAGQPDPNRLDLHLRYAKGQTGEDIALEIGQPVPGFDHIDPFESEGFFDGLGNVFKASLEGSLTGAVEKFLDADDRANFFGLMDDEKIKRFQPNALEQLGIPLAGFAQPLDLAALIGGGVLGGAAAKGVAATGAIRGLALKGGQAIAKGAAARATAGAVRSGITFGTYDGAKGFFEGVEKGGFKEGVKEFGKKLGKGLIFGSTIGAVAGGIPATIGGEKLLGKALAETTRGGAEAFTLGTISPFLEGRTPTVKDYTDAAAFIVSMKAAFGITRLGSKAFKRQTAAVVERLQKADDPHQMLAAEATVAAAEGAYNGSFLKEIKPENNGKSIGKVGKFVQDKGLRKRLGKNVLDTEVIVSDKVPKIKGDEGKSKFGWIDWDAKPKPTINVNPSFPEEKALTMFHEIVHIFQKSKNFKGIGLAAEKAAEKGSLILAKKLPEGSPERIIAEERIASIKAAAQKKPPSDRLTKALAFSRARQIANAPPPKAQPKPKPTGVKIPRQPEIVSTKSPSERVKEAKELFGVTEEPLEAGFVTPDGKMLDFSGRSQTASRFRDDFFRKRLLDHQDIIEVFGESKEAFLGGKQGVSRSEALMRFEEGGSIRVIPLEKGLGVSFINTQKPTAAQWAQINKMARELDAVPRGSIDYDIFDVNGSRITSGTANNLPALKKAFEATKQAKEPPKATPKPKPTTAKTEQVKIDRGFAAKLKQDGVVTVKPESLKFIPKARRDKIEGIVKPLQNKPSKFVIFENAIMGLIEPRGKKASYTVMDLGGKRNPGVQLSALTEASEFANKEGKNLYISRQAVTPARLKEFQSDLLGRPFVSKKPIGTTSNIFKVEIGSKAEPTLPTISPKSKPTKLQSGLANKVEEKVIEDTSPTGESWLKKKRESLPSLTFLNKAENLGKTEGYKTTIENSRGATHFAAQKNVEYTSDMLKMTGGKKAFNKMSDAEGNLISERIRAGEEPGWAALFSKIRNEFIGVGGKMGLRSPYLPHIMREEVATKLNGTITDVRNLVKDIKNPSDEQLLVAIKTQAAKNRGGIVSKDVKGFEGRPILVTAVEKLLARKEARTVSGALRQLERADAGELMPEVRHAKERRLSEIFPSFYETNIKIIAPKYLAAMTKRMGEIKFFGRDSRVFTEALQKVEAVDPAEAVVLREVMARWSGQYDIQNAPRGWNKRLQDWYTAFEVATKIGLGQAAFKNATQWLISFMPRLGAWKSVLGGLDLLDPKNRGFISKSGIGAGLDGFDNAAIMASIGRLPGGGLGKFARFTTKWSGFTLANKINLYWAASTFRRAATDWMKQAQGTGHIAELRRKQLKQFGLDHTKPLTDERIQRAMFDFANNSQLLRNVLNEPLFLTDHRLKPLLLFKRFGIKQTQLFGDMIRKDVFENKNPMPLIRIAIGAGTGGAALTWGLNTLKEAIGGEAVLQQEDSRTRQIIQDFGTVGALGVVGDIMSIDRLSRLTGALKFAVAPVFISDAEAIGGSITKFMSEWERYGDGYIAAKRNAYRIFDVFGTYPRTAAKRLRTDSQVSRIEDMRRGRETSRILELISEIEPEQASDRMENWNKKHPKNQIESGDVDSRSLVQWLERKARTFAEASATKGSPEAKRIENQKRRELLKKLRDNQ